MSKTVRFVMNLKDEVIKASDEAVNRGLEAIGMEAVTMAFRSTEKGGTPVKTGNLRNSITWAVADKHGGGKQGQGGLSEPLGTPDDKTLVIGSNVEYARVIEEGGYGRHAYHMLRNALNDGKDRYEKIMKAALEADKP